MYQNQKEMELWEQGRRDGLKGKKHTYNYGEIYSDGWREGVISRILNPKSRSKNYGNQG